jgi:hypothetical protein
MRKGCSTSSGKLFASGRALPTTAQWVAPNIVFVWNDVFAERPRSAERWQRRFRRGQACRPVRTCKRKAIETGELMERLEELESDGRAEMNPLSPWRVKESDLLVAGCVCSAFRCQKRVSGPM